MKIAVFGAGGVGGYFGGRLAQAGQEVIFIARDQHLTALKIKGLRVDSVEGDFVLPHVEATDNPAEVGPVDMVILGVKAWQVKEAAKAIEPLLGVKSFVLPLQNGIETAVQLAEILGKERIVQGLCRIISQVEAPGHIVHTSPNPEIAFGEFDNQVTDRLKQLQKIFTHVKGVTVDIPTDIEAAMWRKFLFVCSASGLGALTRMPLGIWRSIAETRKMWEQAILETLAVGQAHGVAINAEVIDETRRFIDSLSPLTTFSMQRDIMEGRPSELNSLCGAVVRFGLEVGVDTPMHNFIYYTLLPQELKARGQLM